MSASNDRPRLHTQPAQAEQRAAHSTPITFEPYGSDKEFQDDLRRVFERDYGVTLIGVPLREAAVNVTQYLKTFL